MSAKDKRETKTPATRDLQQDEIDSVPGGAAARTPGPRAKARRSLTNHDHHPI
jgi:hypothetical protein